jgi:hypothetical protein
LEPQVTTINPDPFAPHKPMNFRDASEAGVSVDIERVMSTDTPRPEMPAATDHQVKLPSGIVIDGRVVRTAEPRELTGRDEEDLARAAASNRPERLINTLLLAGVKSIGGVPATEELLNRMLVGDRDALILGIRECTFGPTVDFERYVCAGCGRSFALSIDLADVPVVEAAEPGATEFVVSLKGGRQARVRHATGSDQIALMAATREKTLTVPEQDTVLLARVVLAIDAGTGTWTELSANPIHVRESLSMADRRTIMREMDKLRPGPRLDEVAVTCPDCAHADSVTLSVDALFRG